MRLVLLGLISVSLWGQAQPTARILMLGATDAPNTPVDSPGAGTYSSTQSVTLTDATAQFILYTTTGTAPSCPATGTLYSGAFNISVTTTLKAIGCNGITGGGVLTSVYTINVNSLTFSAISTATTCSGTTCAVTISSPGVASGDLLLIYSSTANAVNVSSISNCGTWTAGPANGNGSAATYTQIGYIYPASAVSTSGSCTVTYTATAGGTAGNAKVFMYDYTVSGSPALDAWTSYLDQTSVSSPFTGPAITLSGSSDVVLAAASADASVTAVGGSWTNKTFSTSGVADQVNVSSVTAPSWTASGVGQWGASAIAFGFGVTSGVYWGMCDWSAGNSSTGSAPTQTQLTNSCFGISAYGPGTQQKNNWYWVTSNNATPGMTFATAAYEGLQNAAPRFYNSGVTYSDTSTVGLAYSTTTGVQYLQMIFPGNDYGVQPNFSATVGTGCVQFYPTIPISPLFNHFDMMTLGGSGGGFSTMQLGSDGTHMYMTLEGDVSSSSNLNLPGTNQWYLACNNYQGTGSTGSTLAVYTISGGVYSSVGSVTAATGAHHLSDITLGNASGAPTTGYNVYFSKFAICFGNGGTTCPGTIFP